MSAEMSAEIGGNTGTHTDALHLVRIPLRIDALARWAGERGWGGGRRGEAFDEGRALHHLLAEAFGPGAAHCFRFLVAPGGSAGSLYLYSEQNAESLREAAESCAWPEHLGVFPLSRLESRAMPLAWRAGQHLGFDLRVRPVRRLLRDLETPRGRMARGAEVDAFLAEALRRHPGEPGGMAGEGRTREAVYLDWLEERLGGAAELKRSVSRLARFRRTCVLRGRSGPEGPDATIHGTLRVSDPDGFAELLRRGIGRHRAYGYGMLLLRPAGRPAPVR